MLSHSTMFRSEPWYPNPGACLHAIGGPRLGKRSSELLTARNAKSAVVGLRIPSVDGAISGECITLAVGSAFAAGLSGCFLRLGRYIGITLTRNRVQARSYIGTARAQGPTLHRNRPESRASTLLHRNGTDTRSDPKIGTDRNRVRARSYIGTARAQGPTLHRNGPESRASTLLHRNGVIPGPRR
jgi:hypothetical protein